MRPSIRLPLRDALYVCSSCRSEVAPRGISPLARQFRRHASSDSPSILERTRRALWKGDKPPGQEDPYSGKSQIARQMGWKESEVPEAENDSEAPALGDKDAAEGRKGGLKEGDDYEQAETWDGLRRIGFLKDEAWVYRGSSDADEYSRFGSDVTPRSLHAAAHQAAVEIGLMQMLDKPLTSICEVGDHHSQIQNIINRCVVEGSEAQQWNTALRFPDQTSMDALVFVFNQIGNITESKIESPENFLVQQKEKGSAALEQPHRALSLADPAVKFAFTKRFAQLIGRRVPDKAISSSTTIGEFIAAISTKLKEKPPNVGKKLAKHRAAGNLPPNVQFTTVRLSRGDNDEALGRKKAIYAELYSRGLVFPKKKKVSKQAGAAVASV